MVRSWSVGVPAGVALLAALLLTGCAPGEPGNDDAAAPSSPGSSGPAPTSSSEEGSAATTDEYVPASLEGPARNVPEPVLPALAKEESLEGAQAFLDYWSDAMWFAYQTGDTSYARNIISPHCEICMDQLDLLDEIYSSGSWAIGGRERVSIQGEALVRAMDGIYKPVVKGSTEGAQLIENGKVALEVPSNAGGTEPFLVYMDHDGEQWKYITAADLAGADRNV
ncbi:DUF6318 family protein [Kocuria flava]